MTERIDLDVPADARRYIEIARNTLLPPTTDRVSFADGKWIEFASMTDEEAVKIARSIYIAILLDIEQAAEGAPRQ